MDDVSIQKDRQVIVAQVSKAGNAIADESVGGLKVLKKNSQNRRKNDCIFGPAGAGRCAGGRFLAARRGWRWLSAGRLLRDTHDGELIHRSQIWRTSADGNY